MTVLHVGLMEPEIASNSGNIVRSCVAVGARAHLIRPLGFQLSDEALKRSGMDYWHQAQFKEQVVLHDSFAAFYQHFEEAFDKQRVFGFTTKASQLYSAAAYYAGDVLLFGPESRGLPAGVRELTQQVRIPMAEGTRSLNLSTSVGIGLYEAWRQLAFIGA